MFSRRSQEGSSAGRAEEVTRPKESAFDEARPNEGGETKPTESGAPSAPLRTETPKFGLVLGPGGLKTLAHAGVLKEINRARLPVVAVVGLEWGALPAALFSAKGEANDVDWQLYKFEQKGWPQAAWLSGKPQPASANALISIFSAAMGRIESGKLRFACPVRRVASGRISWHQSGEMASALNGCVRFPPTIETDSSWVAAPGAVYQALGKVRSLGATRVIFVDVLGGRSLDEVSPNGATKEERYERLLWADVRDAIESARSSFDDWIDVDTDGFDAFSLKMRKDLEARGEAAAKKRLAAILTKYNL